MSYEMLVALNVTDDAVYDRYRAAMRPLLEAHDGGFRYDFKIAQTLASGAAHPVNRVFAIYFGDEAKKTAFFAHPAYREIRQRLFEAAVAGVTTIAEYAR